jgi:hypothetical protein
LTDPANRRKSANARFIERVFTPGEKDLILSSPDPDRTLWSLWACKEAAFKAVSRDAGGPGGAISSSPRKYPVTLELPVAAGVRETRIKGGVATPAGRIPVKLASSGSYVHALATAGEDACAAAIPWRVCSINLARKEITPNVQSALVRREAKNVLAGHLNADPRDLKIIRRKGEGGSLGPPVVLVRGRESGIEISLSHDGVFLAYAFLFN